jgi:hypothetical protein
VFCTALRGPRRHPVDLGSQFVVGFPAVVWDYPLVGPLTETGLRKITPGPKRGEAMRKLTLTITLILASLALASTAAAATTVEKDIPFEATVTGCGDTIALSGTLIGIFTEQELGGGLLLTFHFQPQGLSGTSSSGVPYHGTGLTRETTVFTPRGGVTDTFVNRFHIVGTMGASTYYVKESFHITVTPTGEIAVFFDNFSLECG